MNNEKKYITKNQLSNNYCIKHWQYSPTIKEQLENIELTLTYIDFPKYIENNPKFDKEYLDVLYHLRNIKDLIKK